MALIYRAFLLVAVIAAALLWWAAQQSHLIVMSIPGAPAGGTQPVTEAIASLESGGGLHYLGDRWQCRPLVVLAGAYESTRPRT